MATVVDDPTHLGEGVIVSMNIRRVLFMPVTKTRLHIV
jgi:hypothetical protein